MPKVPARKEPFALKALEIIFIKLPLVLAKALLNSLVKLENRKLVWIIAATCLSLWSAFVIYFAKDDASLPIRIFESAHFAPGWKIGLGSVLSYSSYLLLSLPLFLLAAHIANKKAEPPKANERRREFDPFKIRESRLASDFDKAYLGHSFLTGNPIYLANDQRMMHAEVIGSTGTGKTDSVLVPLLAHDIWTEPNPEDPDGPPLRKKGAIIIDGKGDKELLNHIYYLVCQNKREDDFRFFSLADPKNSHTYNPLLHGNATELKDKIIGSMPWSDEFYRKMAEQATLSVLKGILKKKSSAAPSEQGKTPPQKEALKFRDLHEYMTHEHALKAMHDSIDPKQRYLRQDIRLMLRHFRNNPKFISGLMADLYLTARSEFSWLVDVDYPEIDLLKAYQEGKIVYFQLHLQGYGDTGKRFGRMILQDIRTVSSYIQSKMRDSERRFFPIYIDDAASFLDVNFIEFLNKARASKFAIMLLHQSPGDLVFHRVPSFQQQVVENTNIKIILRQDDPESVEKMTKIGGTRKTQISTYQTQEDILGEAKTGVGSVRDGQEFKIEPDLIRELQLGEAALIWKSPSMHTDYLKLDYIGYHKFIEYPGPNRKQPLSQEAHEQSFEDVSQPLAKIMDIRKAMQDLKRAA